MSKNIISNEIAAVLYDNADAKGVAVARVRKVVSEQPSDKDPRRTDVITDYKAKSGGKVVGHFTTMNKAEDAIADYLGKVVYSFRR